MTTIAITGIGGFIGLQMARRALALGWTVQGMDIAPAGVARARAAGARVEQGDINDADVLARAFAGTDVVFHTAAVVQEDGPRELYDRVNNEGTRSVCRAAMAAGVKRLVHLSSIMVYGFAYPQNVAEDGPFDVAGNPYNETKLSSERIALGFNNPAAGFGVMVLRPGDVYGLGSVPWVHRPLEALQKRMFALPSEKTGVINHVHVDNLVDAVFLVLQKDCCGESFNITDDAATPCHEFFGHLAGMVGRRVLFLPAGLMRTGLSVAAKVLPVVGQQPLMQPAVLRFLQRQHKISCAKARQQLGYVPAIGLEAGMRRLETDLHATRLL
ncbi:MAG: NAD-dependent epimerase/dehydratase family protein [Moraxellaceae bacterium]|nr:NAD-dependent epimerase/dehydratase family protein [Moraxellaceae bacterium]